MNQLVDEDGDAIILTAEEKMLVEEEIHNLDSELVKCRANDKWRELHRQRRHLVLELAAGRRLPLSDDRDIQYDYEILPLKAEAGGGWRLRLLQDGEEVGGGVFPLVMDEEAGSYWWSHLTEADRQNWSQRAESLPVSVTGAYQVYLQDEAWHDANQVAGEWLDSRPSD